MTAPSLSKCSCVLRALDVGGFILGSFYATSGSLAALGWGWLEGSSTGVNMKKSVLTLTPLYFHLWCALSSFYSWWLFSYGAQTWTSLDTEQLLALLFFLMCIGISTMWWVGRTASPVIRANVWAAGIPLCPIWKPGYLPLWMWCTSSGTLLPRVRKHLCDFFFFLLLSLLKDVALIWRGRRATQSFTVSALWWHLFCCEGHQIKPGLGTYIYNDITP